MCILIPNVDSVTNTNIFARSVIEDNSQYIAYQMNLSIKHEVAMILPIPICQNATENDFEFINLQNYPNFFKDLENLFPSDNFDSFTFTKNSRGIYLPVYEIGDYIATFIPTIKDFDKVDPRFIMPDVIFDHFPYYKEYGFAVFQFKKPFLASGLKPHPMAFKFKSFMPESLYFPTVHMHDGVVHQYENFDHVLYFQGDYAGIVSENTPDINMINLSKGILDNTLVKKLILYGNLPNIDITL